METLLHHASVKQDGAQETELYSGGFDRGGSATLALVMAPDVDMKIPEFHTAARHRRCDSRRRSAPWRRSWAPSWAPGTASWACGPGALRRSDGDHGSSEPSLRRRAHADGRSALRAARRPRNLFRRGPRGEPAGELRAAGPRRCGRVHRVGVCGGDKWVNGRKLATILNQMSKVGSGGL